MKPKNVAELIVECLENEGVEYVFGLPGEENIQIGRASCRERVYDLV